MQETGMTHRKYDARKTAMLPHRHMARATLAARSSSLSAGLLCSAAMLAFLPAAEAATTSSYAPCATGTTAPPTTGTTIFTANVGANGKGGESSSFEGPGHAGDPGQPGGTLGYTATAPLNAVGLFSLGGTGGEGSNAGGGNAAGSNGGGVGTSGGAGGTVTLTTSAEINATNLGSLNSAVCASSTGGTGGAAGLPQDNGPKHQSGPGGDGGNVTVTINSTVNSPTGAGVIAASTGGDGADGKSQQGTEFFGPGGQGGLGGAAGVVTVVNNGMILTNTSGIVATSTGGDGGTGGDARAYGTVYKAGAGGDGTAGGTATIMNNGSIATTNDGAAGIWALSQGGVGGDGGGVGAGGAGGNGGNGGTAQIMLQNGGITVAGDDAPGVLAQSLGGLGGAGGSAISGGPGGTGGDGGSVVVQGGGTIVIGAPTAPATDSQGILAQSIGGGGGKGGAANNGTQDEIGGNAGTAANGGPISVDIGTQITTYGDRSQGILVQSIGGGGGSGGNATGTGVFINLTIGGKGGGGGDGDTIQVSSAGVVQTDGEHAPGMLLQSIGGGGGSGGAGIGTVTNDLIGIQVTVGGSAGAGGDGGSILPQEVSGVPSPTNAGVILTTGAEAAGIQAQSIGGGGGMGAPSTADATDGTTKVSVNILHAIGGNGGAGGQGGNVTIQNSGLLLTAGADSPGIAAQSVGGGGGSADDAATMFTAKKQTIPVTVTQTVGGTQGSGGTGGTVALTNAGLIVTTGADADGMLSQSIGGGGGTTGVGDGASTQTVDVSTSLGTTGGSGGNGGASSLTNNSLTPNSGAILTLGDGAVGLLAQSIGGGGGRVGGGAGDSSQASSFTMQETLGATVGGGSSTTASGPAVNVTNAGPILTFGADAAGVIAQSIGGGGGLLGKGASDLGFAKSTGDGGNGINTAVPGLANLAAAGTGVVADYSTIGDLLNLANTLLGNPAASGTFVQALGTLSASAGSYSDSGTASFFDVAITLGAAGSGSQTPPSWDGGATQVTNTGDIATAGRMSTGIVAQSIGDGGGIAGAANAALTTTTVGADTTFVTLGGSAGSLGDGGTVTVQNATGASITTAGSDAPGIVAQSIGGGGGMASLSGSSTGLLGALNVVFNGAGAYSSAQGVTVTNGGEITTLSHDSPGIIAQSIAGGGGLVRLLATDQETSSGQVINGGSYQYYLTFGGGTGGNAGSVSVAHTGSITTAGNDAYGILAQSIGGGGGAVLGGVPAGSTFFGSTGLSGNAGDVTVAVGNASGAAGGGIATTGQGGVAILAQSIGGGGGLAGDLGLTAQRSAFPQQFVSDGDGGNIAITVYGGASLITQGVNTPVIFAQSIGGGGGHITNNVYGAYDGSLGGTGTAGSVTVNVYGAILASGVASPGIFAEAAASNGYIGGPLTVTIYNNGVVQGGYNFNPGDGYGAGVYFVGGGPASSFPNVVTIQAGGTLTSLGGKTGTAVYSTGGYTEVVNAGTLIGAVDLDNGGGSGTCTGTGCPATADAVSAASTRPGSGELMNAAGGLLESTSIRLGGGTLTNAGTFDVRAGGSGVATLSGNYHGLAGGVLQVGADFAHGTSDELAVDGTAVLDAGHQVRIDVANWQKGIVQVMTATGGITQSGVEAVASAGPVYLFGINATQPDSNTLQVQTSSNLRSAASDLAHNQQAVAGILDQLWNTGDPAFAAAADALATVGGDKSYRSSLNSLAGASVSGVAAAKEADSERFTNNLVNCDAYDQASSHTRDGSCDWFKIDGTRTSLANGDDEPGFSQDAVTYQLGAQREVTPGWIVGASLGYEASWLTGDSDGSKVSGDTALFGLMVKHPIGNWTLTGVLDGGYGWYQSVRQITVGSVTGAASGSPTAANAGIHLGASYAMPLGAWYLKPSITAAAIYRGMSGYNETGSTPFNLSVRSSSDVVGSVEPMAEFGRVASLAGTGTIHTFVGVGADFVINNNWTTQAGFQIDPGNDFSARLDLPSAVGKLRAGLDLFTVRGVEAKLSYDVDLAPGYSAQSIIGRLAYTF
jgi:hypothetical protein